MQKNRVLKIKKKEIEHIDLKINKNIGKIESIFNFSKKIFMFIFLCIGIYMMLNLFNLITSSRLDLKKKQNINDILNNFK